MATLRKVARCSRILTDVSRVRTVGVGNACVHLEVVPQPSGIWVRTLFGFKLPLPSGKPKTLEYSEKKLLGYSQDQMYDVVSRVDHYCDFLPWCTKSEVVERKAKSLLAKMQIGFPPIMESYTSSVLLERPSLVKATCYDGRLFNHLDTVWRFDPGLPDSPKTCILHFKVSFEFKSRLHSKLAQMFFDEIVRQMTQAFMKRALALYGPPTPVATKDVAHEASS
ncbi:coenzyme Q-binding protein COQ10 homolog B, mitochondrial-like isoform X2 [Ornithodoros turicata]|uniref:coenzyme Q-binding protein COQ10 homolog B, mitochondrial-like isoform X2 n=1 Tax=Ornithodoros turicata TaxID=34597 RepID=UPI0031387A9E